MEWSGSWDPQKNPLADDGCCVSFEIGAWKMRRGAVRNPNVVGETKERRVRTKTSCFPPLLVKRGPMKSFGRRKKEARDAWVVVSLWNEECFSCCCRGFILENASPPPLSLCRVHRNVPMANSFLSRIHKNK